MFSEYREHVDEPRDLVVSHVQGKPFLALFPPVISVRTVFFAGHSLSLEAIVIKSA
jgi:hypothetical protein